MPRLLTKTEHEPQRAHPTLCEQPIVYMKAAYSTGMMASNDEETVNWQRNVDHEQLYVDDVKRHDVRRTCQDFGRVPHISFLLLRDNEPPPQRNHAFMEAPLPGLCQPSNDYHYANTRANPPP